MLKSIRSTAKASRKKGETYTVSWFDEDPDVLASLNMYPVHGFKSFGVTEIEGTATGAELKKMSKELGDGVVIDVASGGKLPTGIHWLEKRYLSEE
ncbi:hypothetical protein [Paenibacillus hexagrammi]|uniref:Uncharacterized protein n=1 Tax=Paenibacillus hexagrammi TaxID=2908839 RepID=A0ABY3SJX1_9BACL|nr:hypothetical protein [Paenibacillus sp. YPD9-1]UJF34009.1 hypothetical protein L0M14_01860 [Paenibacillus sp. YPD9-1]